MFIGGHIGIILLKEHKLSNIIMLIGRPCQILWNTDKCIGQVHQ